MSKFLEIEVKYDATGITAKEFIRAVRKEFGRKFRHVKGTDVYYKKGSNSIRYRRTTDLQELTVKKRHSKKSTTVRTEVNLELPSFDQTRETDALLKLIGYDKHVTLKKSYYIATFPVHSDLEGIGEIVWYEVKSRGKPTRQFIEIEVRGSPDNKKNLAYLEGRLKLAVNSLQDKEPLNKSLYELYK